MDYVDCLSRFTHLHTLTVNVDVNKTYYDSVNDFFFSQSSRAFYDGCAPDFDQVHAKNVVRHLFQSFFWDGDKGRERLSQLRELQVRFLQKEYRHGHGTQSVFLEWPIKLRRHERDDAKSVLKGGFDHEAVERWVDVE